MSTHQSLNRRPYYVQSTQVRLAVSLTVVLGTAGLALTLAFLPGPTWTQVLRHPAFLWLVVTGLMMDAYRILPFIRRATAHESTLWTTSIAFAAILAIGPRGAIIWPVTSMLMSLARGLPRWRLVLNLGHYAGQAAAVSAVLVLVDPRLGSAAPDLGIPTLATVPALLAAALAARVLNALVVVSLDVATFGEPISQVISRYLRTRASVLLVHVGGGSLVAVTALASPTLLPLIGMLLLAAYHRFARTAVTSLEARRDPLTGLANRTALQAAMSGRIDSRRPPTWPVLMVVDLDRFKQVNDALGHAAGDQALIAASQRLRRGTRADDLVSRIGGDEFAVLLAEGTSLDDAREVATRVIRAMSTPYLVGSRWFDIAASVGLAVAPEHGRTTVELLASADKAMYLAKSCGGGGVRVYATDVLAGPA